MRTILVTILLVLVSSQGFAQDHFTALYWSGSYPVQDTRDFISDFSWRGFGLEGRRLLKQDGYLSVGLNFTWNVMNQTTTEKISLENEGDQNFNADITGTQRRYLNAFPMMLTSHFYFGNQDQPQFYIGIGAGAYYMMAELQVGVFSKKENKWMVGGYPEVGFIFPAGESSLMISGKYNYALPTDDNVNGQEVAWTWFSVQVGFAYWAW